MKNKTIYGLVVALVLIASFSSIAIAGDMEEGDAYETELSLGYMSIAPTIDGDININEWSDAIMVDIEYEVADPDSFTNDTIYLYFGNDANFLYFAFDMTYIVNGSDQAYFIWEIDEDDDDEFEYELEDGNEQWVYFFSDSEGGMLFFGEDSINSKTGGEGTFSVIAPTPTEFDGGTFNASLFSNKPLLWGKGFDESINSDDEHLILEFAVPITNIQNGEAELGDTVRFVIGCYMDVGDEEMVYPIDVVDPEEADSSSWAELTLATVPVAPVEGYSATDYAMMMFFIGTVIFVILLIARKETVYKWIAEGKDRYLILTMGIGVFFFILGFLEWYYHWLSTFGL